MTYAVLAYYFMGLAAVVTAIAALVRRPGSRWWGQTVLTTVGLLILTIVFDNVIIALDLVGYDESQLSGVYLALVPIEDLAWSVVAGMMVPSLWLLFTPPTAAANSAASARPNAGEGKDAK